MCRIADRPGGHFLRGAYLRELFDFDGNAMAVSQSSPSDARSDDGYNRGMKRSSSNRRRWFQFGLILCMAAAGCNRHVADRSAPTPEETPSPEEIRLEVKKRIEYVDGTRSGHQFANITLLSINVLGDLGPEASDALPALEKFVRGESKYLPESDEKAAAEKAIAKIKGEIPREPFAVLGPEWRRP